MEIGRQGGREGRERGEEREVKREQSIIILITIYLEDNIA